jgi:hypothetical protein
MRYKPKSSAALHLALGGLPAQMPVKVDADIELSVQRQTSDCCFEQEHQPFRKR